MLEVKETTAIAPNVSATHIAFVTNEGRRFLVNKNIMRRSSLLIGQLLEALGGGDEGETTKEILELPLPAIDSETLEAVHSFVSHHYGNSNPSARPGPTNLAKGSSAAAYSAPTFKEIEKPLKSDLSTLLDPWDWSYVSQTLLKGKPDGSNGTTLLFMTLNASNFLNIPPLRELCSAAVANMLRGRSDSDILALFGVSSFTAADEEEICNDYPWLREADV
eukprot:GILI01025165.1.p1 GENE.GILI01025165.1~~GILI01025165.1.p1  ORF type:complete len:236 (+),score=25.04 GILI01025165.1:49-708(+)